MVAAKATEVSIALATFNGSRYLAEQLDSFLAQTRLPDELVVCDDNSSDTTTDILEDFRSRAPFDVHIHRNPENLGHARNFEKALALCRGSIIFVSDQDDAWSTTKIAVVQDAFKQNPDIDVVINDAHYTDEHLNPSGVTVLNKVLHVGGTSSAHIAGACTALTARFRDFIVPFPRTNCPQHHDVYIHRWANLIANKLVLTEALQLWRIHASNTTADNEMNSPELDSVIGRYQRAKDIDPAMAYLKTAAEFRAMGAILAERRVAALKLPLLAEPGRVESAIGKAVDAYDNRAKLSSLSRFGRWRLIAEMIAKGQYTYFKGVKSIAKDLLRS